MKKLITFTSLLCLVYTVCANNVQDVATEATWERPPSTIETIIPNRSYLLKLDCSSCPYLIRRSNRNEWEDDPRPNQLNLALYIDGPYPLLYLQGETLNPLWYERRAPNFYFYGPSHGSVPPFTANQDGTNATLQQEENNNGWGMPTRQFELAYEFDMVTYAPKDRVWEWEVFIEFEITGLRHEEHVPKDIPFYGSGVDEGVEGAVPGVTSIVRLILEYTAVREKRIKAVELMPKESMAKYAGKEIETLRKAIELKGEKSITTADWGGRLRDINGPDGRDMYTEHASFQPGEWNDCGRKDESGRQIMCKVDEFREWSPVAFLLSLILLAIVLVGMFILTVFVFWLAIRFLRGQRNEEVAATQRETDALLLFGDEELEEEEKDKKKKKEVTAAQTLDQAAHTSERKDSQQFGPYQYNTGDDG